MRERFWIRSVGLRAPERKLRVARAATLLPALVACACATSVASRDRASPVGLAPGPALALREARSLPLIPPFGLAWDASGNTFVAGALSTGQPVDFGGERVVPAGQGDLLFGSLDPSGRPRWVRTVADQDGPGTVRFASGAAVTRDGRMVVQGRFSGKLTIGGSTIESANEVDLLAAVDATSGALLWAKKLDSGTNGAVTAMAANPRSAANRIAVCGHASAAADFAPGSSFGGGIHDLVIGVLDSEGRLLWSQQLGGSGYESCTAVAVDDAGDVYAAGQFDGVSLTFPGPTPVTLTGPCTTARKFMWVARFHGAGSGGAASVIAAAEFHGAAGQVRPNALALGQGGALLVAGQFSSSLSLGDTPCGVAGAAAGLGCLLGAGSTDAFVARLEPSARFAPVWAVRLGGTGRDEAYGVAATAAGDVLAVGRVSTSLPSFKEPNGGKDTSGADRLSTSGTANPDAFVLRLDARSGATSFAEVYGDGTFQQADVIAVDPSGPGQGRLAIAGTLGGTATFGAAGKVTSLGGSGLGAFLLFATIGDGTGVASAAGARSAP